MKAAIFKGIKDLQVEDLSPLDRVRGLEWLSITWNTKLTSLEPLASLKGLTRLSISDTPKVRDLDPIGNLSSLVALNYSGGIWNKATATTLEPLARLEALELHGQIAERIELGLACVVADGVGVAQGRKRLRASRAQLTAHPLQRRAERGIVERALHAQRKRPAHGRLSSRNSARCCTVKSF